MAAPGLPTSPVGPDTLITVKVLFDETNRRFKLPLRDLGARVFPLKLRQLLAVPAESEVILERYSDSAASYVRLDSDNPAIYKQLYRAAKAKLKLRIKATTVTHTPPIVLESEPQRLIEPSTSPEPAAAPVDTAAQRYSYLETVLSPPLPPRPANPATTSAVSDAPSSSMSENQVLDRSSEAASASNEAQPFSFTATPGPVTYPPALPFLNSLFSIECNSCGRSVLNEHYHCSICDDGDYDLCIACIQAGVYCPGQGHWMIKRSVQGGKMVNSTTERLAPRRQTPTINAEADVVDTKAAVTSPTLSTTPPLNNLSTEPETEKPANEERTCNACFKEQDVARMVTCSDCEDYDLCVTCLLKDAHGHHPAHVFSLIQDRDFCLRSLVQSRCRPGRHFHHAAICDGCNKRIVGVRHKCLTCPDWDFCWRCIKTANTEHPGHRFAPVYGALGDVPVHTEVHTGIFCDGPLCQDPASQRSITGVRYKCAVCHDTDFCAACEAHPKNTHNRTHPLIKFNTEVRNVSVSTYSDDGIGGPVRTLGDRSPSLFVPQPSAPVVSNTGSAVSFSSAHTLIPEEKAEVPTSEENEHTEGEDSAETKTTPTNLEFNALFAGETVPDGTQFAPGVVFQQTWTLRNPGPLIWPVGCSVRFVGGDSMLNVDNEHPSSVEAITSAMESNELTRPVAPGESAEFTVALKASIREGTSISYWRLKLPDGTPFGHKLWCHIQVKDTVPKAEETALDGSNMVFPKLEKESPVTSIHEELTPAATQPSTTTTAVPSVSNVDTQSVLEDVESLTLEDAETDDEEFLTDEEYDILDASDQEFADRH